MNSYQNFKYKVKKSHQELKPKVMKLVERGPELKQNKSFKTNNLAQLSMNQFNLAASSSVALPQSDVYPQSHHSGFYPHQQ